MEHWAGRRKFLCRRGSTLAYIVALHWWAVFPDGRDLCTVDETALVEICVVGLLRPSVQVFSGEAQIPHSVMNIRLRICIAHSKAGKEQRYPCTLWWLQLLSVHGLPQDPPHGRYNKPCALKNSDQVVPWWTTQGYTAHCRYPFRSCG